jgi:D-alanyl-lipoteichoic acid acyltransferase DltB (MBOAT superfamily)
MLFNSVGFIFLFLPLTALAFFLLAHFSHRAAATALTLASLAFYAMWNPVYLPLLLGSILGNFLIGQRILAARATADDGPAHDRLARRWMALGIVANLLLLGWWKYAGFFSANLQALTGWPHQVLAITLPLGISFFTFTQIAYLVDARRGLVHRSVVPRKRGEALTHYALFVSYFPHLIAGPILHHGEMMPQFAERRVYRFSWDNLAIGLTLFAIGLVKKTVFADSLIPGIRAGFDQAAHGTAIGFAPAWLSAIAYSLQIYFDFSGYSDMAIGASRLFGIHLPLNFNSPYRATSIIDFWHRWHMTLSRFLRDYLYFPLGGNRHGSARRYLNLMIVMLLGGLWHGAAWTFVVWGGLHGLYLVINHLWQHLRGGENHQRQSAPLPRFASQMLTYLAVVIAWVPFRATDLTAAASLLADMAGLHGAGAWDPQLGATAMMCLPLLLIAWFLPNSQQIMALHMPAAIPHGLPLMPDRAAGRRWWQWRPDRAWSLAFSGALACALYLVVFTHRISDFLYFQF